MDNIRGMGMWLRTLKAKKVSHTRYRALGLELIPVYRQSACRWLSHPAGGRLPLLSARPVFTSPAAQHHCPLAGTKLYCLVTEAHRCEQLAQCWTCDLPSYYLLQHRNDHCITRFNWCWVESSRHNSWSVVLFSSVYWRCWLDDRKDIQHVKTAQRFSLTWANSRKLRCWAVTEVVSLFPGSWSSLEYLESRRRLVLSLI